MLRLLENFDELFDLSYQVGDTALGELLERTLSELDNPGQNWGAEGRREELFEESEHSVSFYYRPHLFPGMDLKLRLAHELQCRLLPRQLPQGSPASISSVLESYCHLSGDLFGWEMLDDGRFLIWIADMAGHGVRAGLASAVLRVLIDTLPRRNKIGPWVSDLNQALHDCLKPECSSLYATLFLMTLDSDGNAAYCSAAHPPVLLRRSSGEIEELVSLDRPVGLFGDTPYRTADFRLESEDCLLLYTDGLVEATGWDGEPFGCQRLRDLLVKKSADPRELTKSIYREITRRQDIDKLEDDVTFLALKL